MPETNSDQLVIIPGVGKSIADDLRRIGIVSVGDLVDKDPEQLYNDLASLDGHPHDRCTLYVFRCAVYFAETEHPQPEKLLWWNWKD